MPVYMVERNLPGATLECVEAVQRAAKATCQAFADEGKPVRYLRCTFTPGDSRCRCLFEAANADLVQQVNEVAQIPYSRIVMAVELELPSGSSEGRAGNSVQAPNPDGS